VPNPTPASITATQRLADVLLDGDLDGYVASRRAAGRSWRLIARDLLADVRIDVTEKTLRSWYPNLAEDREAS
jgi:hypothetical protein